MNILVCISRTPDTTARIAFKENNTIFDTDNVQHILNPYDEWYALVKALELKEAHGGTVTLVHVGTAESDAIIRKGLAIGGDEAHRINCHPKSAWETAQQIAAFAKDKAFDLILTGKETIDYNSSMVGGILAELLNLPFVSYVSDLEKDGDAFKATRDIEGGKEVLKVQGAFVLSASKGLAEQRIPNMRGIMMAKRKPLNVVEPAEVVSHTQYVSYELPPPKAECKYVDADNMDELVRLLNQEAKVI